MMSTIAMRGFSPPENMMPDSTFRRGRLRATARSLLLAWLAMLGSTSAEAQLINFHSTNVQYLVGSDYEYVYFDAGTGRLGSREDSRSIITLEHANDWKYGDNFLFIDTTNPWRDSTTTPTNYYGEFSPRFSFGKIGGRNLNDGLIKDVLLTTTAEVGEGFRNYLYGVAVDLNLPATTFFQVNYYVRNEIGPATDTGRQLTLAWLKPFTIGSAALAFEGFFDYAWGMDHKEDNIISAPRLMLDVGKAWGAPGVLQAGLEYQFWRNKFGIDDIDEDVPQLIVKWTF